MGLLDGKAAIVTGSARGIGRATAELMAAEGAKVLINDLDADVAAQTASEIDAETVVFAGDLTKEGACDDLVATAVEAFGEVDICVNNAGYTWDGVAHKMGDEQFQAMLDIHTVVPFRVARALAPFWREAAKKERDEGVERFRKLINTSSTTGMMGNAGQVNYAAGKAGVVGITKTLAKEWGQFKINVNAVAFGFIETRMTMAREEGGSITTPTGEEIGLGVPDQIRSMAAAAIPLGRPGTAREAAGPVLFLASPLADYVQGQVLTITGGAYGGMYS
jgi:3-oxoacyl-[acyl-carrier protein] reductase